MPTRVAVFGSGSWGTAFALILADAGCDVTLWARRPELVDAIPAEGVTSCTSVLGLARRHHVDMPIVETMSRIIHDGISPQSAVKELMSRTAKAEH